MACRVERGNSLVESSITLQGDEEQSKIEEERKLPDVRKEADDKAEPACDQTLKLIYEHLTRKEEGKKNSQPTDSTHHTVQQSWEQIMKTVDSLDDDLVRGYKEDIDTLLVFTGLFSAVVTAFTVEFYKRLEADPAEMTVVLLNNTVSLLAQIVQQSSQPLIPTPSQNSTPSSADIRINTFWFLSLTLALVDALFCLLCKQWVREHQRQINTQTPGQALALRWLRHQSFERWHVPSILASLPILLEIALFLFLAGLLELLWSRHHIPFAIALAVVGLAVLFYVTTTILPCLSIIQQALHIHPYFASDKPEFDPVDISRLPSIDFICPYKSPQSWLVFRLFSFIYRLPGCKKVLYYSQVRLNRSWNWNDGWDSIDDLHKSITKNILNLYSWSSLDLNVIQRFSRIRGCPDLYELKGFRWLVQETRDSPSMIPHLKNVLAELPGHLVMPTVFDQWDSPSGKPAWTSVDVESSLEFPQGGDNGLFSDHSSPDKSTLASQILAFRHLLVTYARSGSMAEAAKTLWRRIQEQPKNNRLIRAFFCHEELLFGPSTDWRARLLYFYRQHWDELNVDSQVQLSYTLSKSILAFLESSEYDIGSTLLTSSLAVHFFTSVNNKLCENKEFYRSRNVIASWMDVLSHMRRIHQLPLLYFKPVPGCFAIPRNELRDLLNNSPTSELALGSLVDSYEQLWGTALNYQKGNLISTLSEHINHISSLPLETTPLDSDSSEELPTLGSYFITSKRGLQFLSLVNNELAGESSVLLSWLRLCDSGTIDPWVSAIENIQSLLRLPSGYFKPIPKRDEETDRIVGWYQPKRKVDEINAEPESPKYENQADGEEKTGLVEAMTGEERRASLSSRKKLELEGGPGVIKIAVVSAAGSAIERSNTIGIRAPSMEVERRDKVRRIVVDIEEGLGVGGPGAENSV